MKTRNAKVILSTAIVLLMVWAFTSCSKKNDATPVVVDKTALGVSLDSGKYFIINTSEGALTGQYESGAKANLFVAVDAAQIVFDNATVTAEIVTNATASLNAAITTYKSHYIAPIDPASLVGQWTFDEVANTTVGTQVKDYSGNNHNGTIQMGHAFWGAGLPTLATDRKGVDNKALHFDMGGNVEIPYATALNPSVMTISVWAKPDVNDPVINNQYFLAMNRWNGYKWNFQDTPRAFFTVTYDDPAASPTPVSHVCCYNRDQNVGIAQQGVWHQYVVAFGGGHETYYIDGALVYDWTDTPGTISQLPSAVNLVFGQDLPTSVYVTGPDSDPNYVNYGGYYIGALDEVRIYNKVLTGPQVTSIYNSEKP